MLAALPTQSLGDDDKKSLEKLRDMDLDGPKEQRIAFRLLESLWNKSYEELDGE
jgi:hypothetical protein